MGTIALQIARTGAGSVDPAQPVIFDTVLYSAGDIGYNAATGVVTFNQPGRYFINWWAATQTTLTPNGVVFALSSSQGDNIQSGSPAKTGELSGLGVLEVAEAPVTLSLLNQSAGSAFFSSALPVKSSLTVSSDEPPAGLADTSICTSVSQLAHVLTQLIALYPASVMSVFNTNLNVVTGTPSQLFASPEAERGGLFVVLDNLSQPNAVPLNKITAVYAGDGTVYDPSITYLPAPSPLPPGCDTDIIAAIRDYLPLMTEVLLQMGVTTQATGDVYRNEYGLLVLSDADGNTPVFVPTYNIARIVTNAPGARSVPAGVSIK